MAEHPMQMTEDLSPSIPSDNTTPNEIPMNFSTEETQNIPNAENMFTNMSQEAINQAFLNQQLASQQELNNLLARSAMLSEGMMLIDTPTLPSQELLNPPKVHSGNLDNLIVSGESTPSGDLTPQEHAMSSMMQIPSHGGYHSEVPNLVMANDMMNSITPEQQFFENMLTDTNTQGIISNPQNLMVPDNLPIDPPRSVPSMNSMHSTSDIHMSNIFAGNNMMNFDMGLSQPPQKHHSIRSNRPAHLRHGYSKSVSMFPPPNQPRPSTSSQYVMSNLQPMPNPQFIPTVPSEQIPPTFQKQMVENTQMLHAMRKKMGHRRQYSAPELNSGFSQSPEKHLLRQTTEGQMLKQRGFMQMTPINQTSPHELHGLTPEQIEALTLNSHGDSEPKPLKILEYTADGYGVLRPNNANIGDPMQDFRYGGDDASPKPGTKDDLSTNEKLKSLDNLTREELIKRLRNVESELAKTKSSPIKSPNLKVETSVSSCGDTASEQGDETGTGDSVSPIGINLFTSQQVKLEDRLGDDEDEDEDDPEEDEDSKDEEKSEKSQTFDCLWSDCSKSFPALDVLISHIGQEHIGSGKASYKCEWQGCPRNQKPFTKRHKMYNHLRTHTGERPFQCPVADCGKRFSRPDSLATHVKTHSNVRPYICPVPGCGKAYYHSRSLRKHIKSHEMTRPLQIFSQNIPGVSPQNMMDLNNHQLLGANQLGITQGIKYHHYQPDSSTFSTPKPGEDLNSISNTQTSTSAGGAHGSSTISPNQNMNAQMFPISQVDVSNLRDSPTFIESPNMIEPPVLQSHQFPGDDANRMDSSIIGTPATLTPEMLNQLIQQVTPPIPSSHPSTPSNEELGSSFIPSTGFSAQVMPTIPTTQTQ
ncbi:hypothetical protein K7432_000735 [Basidiobolus ranarum]|uniref:C2H2-type domain-containing protein n=1 Tax=Basidiobolus ranarum TaxID=34480 RepID=A0ABR2WAS9_9FUNG